MNSINRCFSVRKDWTERPGREGGQVQKFEEEESKRPKKPKVASGTPECQIRADTEYHM